MAWDASELQGNISSIPALCESMRNLQSDEVIRSDGFRFTNAHNCVWQLPRLQRTLSAVVNESEKHEEAIQALKARSLSALCRGPKASPTPP
jgi:hypothetical protein